MHIADISIIGWIHTIGCIAALVFGAWNLVAAKGTPRHKFRGLGYTISMVVAMGLSLLIYRFDIPLVRSAAPGPDVFGLFHWLAINALFFTLLGYYAASRQNRGFWAYAHPISMTLSYYFLVNGLISELFSRINALRPFEFTIVNSKPVFGSPVLRMTQLTVELSTLFLLILFSAKVWRYRHSRDRGIAM
ncbi:MAG TPA: hypothetical protein VGR81_07900 [Candidatus Acidoferrales bacterium]|nr:hypothetical protein [Candidatus Acidoferrales bacterium]